MTAGRLDGYLEHAARLPAGLVAHARAVLALDQALKAWLAPQGPWARQVTLANFRPPHATLIVSSAAAATPLRYQRQQVLDWLGAQTGQRFETLDISIRARPGTP